MPVCLKESEKQFLIVMSRTNTIMVGMANVLKDSLRANLNQSITYHPEAKETFRNEINQLRPQTASEWLAICEAPPDLVRLVRFSSRFANFEVWIKEPIYKPTYHDFQDVRGEWWEICNGQELVNPGISVDSMTIYEDAARAMCASILTNKGVDTLPQFEEAWKKALVHSILMHFRNHIRDLDISDPKITKAFDQINPGSYDDSKIQRFREAQDVISELS